MKITWPLTVAAMLLMSGCESAAVLPVAVYSLDGLSYASSGKGLADHAISAAEHKDCAVLRLAQTGDLCKVDAALREAPSIAMVGGDLDSVARDPGVREALADAGHAVAEGADARRASPARSVSQDAKSDDSSVPFN